jgi:hypothetical protein
MKSSNENAKFVLRFQSTHGLCNWHKFNVHGTCNSKKSNTAVWSLKCLGNFHIHWHTYWPYIVLIRNCSQQRWLHALTSFIYSFIFQHPFALIFGSLISIYKCKHNFHFKCYLITCKIHKMSFKMSSVATCFGLTRPSSVNYQLEEMTTLHGLTRQYYHAVTARRRIWEMYARTFLMLFLCTAFRLCSLCAIFLRQVCVYLLTAYSHARSWYLPLSMNLYNRCPFLSIIWLLCPSLHFQISYIILCIFQPSQPGLYHFSSSFEFNLKKNLRYPSLIHSNHMSQPFPAFSIEYPLPNQGFCINLLS